MLVRSDSHGVYRSFAPDMPAPAPVDSETEKKILLSKLRELGVNLGKLADSLPAEALRAICGILQDSGTPAASAPEAFAERPRTPEESKIAKFAEQHSAAFKAGGLSLARMLTTYRASRCRTAAEFLGTK